MKHVLNQISLDKNMTKYSFDTQMLQITSMLMKMAGQMNMDIKNELLQEKSLLDSLAELSTMQDAEILFGRIVTLLCRKSRNDRKDIEYFNLQRILNFIDEHIYEDLSMDTITDSLNVSASHVYKTLRSNCDKTFVEYLTEKKLEKACDLLQQGMKVKDVANTLGYSSSRYFIRVFKRYKGSSPNQYKCIMQNQ